MKKCISIIGVIFFILISCNVVAQEEDEFDKYKKTANNVNAEELKVGTFPYDQKNEIEGSIGSFFIFYTSAKFNYRRTIISSSNVDVGLNLGLGVHRMTYVSIGSLKTYGTSNYPFILSSVSLTAGKYRCFQIDFGAEYILNSVDDIAITSNIIPYVNIFYVKKSYTTPFVFKIGGGIPFAFHMSFGMRF